MTRRLRYVAAGAASIIAIAGLPASASAGCNHAGGGGWFTWGADACGANVHYPEPYALGGGYALGGRVLYCAMYFKVWHNATLVEETAHPCRYEGDSYWTTSAARFSFGGWAAWVTVQVFFDIRWKRDDGRIITNRVTPDGVTLEPFLLT
jgi:hypothetical protein